MLPQFSLRTWLIAALFSLLALAAQAQCVPDSLVNSTPGGLYPTVLPVAIGCQYYEEIISFKLPQDTTTTFAGQTVTVNFNFFTIDSLSGLPQGMSWECNLAPDCRYVVHPDSIGLDTVGCITLFGTPTIPATYNVTVHLTANVDLFGNPSPNPATLSQPLQVAPCQFEGDCYTLALSDNCSPATLDITNNIPSEGKAGFTYQWQVNGPDGLLYQTSDENPFPQVLPDGGDYIVDFQADIDTVGFVLQGLEILQVGCDDNIFGGNAPDIYWTLRNPSGQTIVNTQSNIISNATLPIDMGISNLLLDTGQYRIQVWDDEAIGGPQGCATGTVNGGAALFFTVPPAQTGTFTLISGNLHIRFTIDNPIQTIACTDTISVDSLPLIPALFREGDSLLTDTTFFCAGSQTTLSTSSNDSLLWYQDGDLLVGVNDTLLTVNEAGIYRVEAVDRNTLCTTSSAAVQVDSVEVLAPTVTFDAGVEVYFVDGPSDTVDYFWYDFDGNLVEEGDSFEPDANGDYYAVAVDTATGCPSPATEIFNFTSGLTDRALIGSWSVAPNPSQGRVMLRADMQQPSEVAVELMDLTGRSVWQHSLGTKQGSWEVALDFSALPPGIYLLRLQAGPQQLQSRLVLHR